MSARTRTGYFEALKPRVEVIPMIDIMMFLLVFFVVISLRMIAGTGVPMEIPGSKTTQSIKQDGQVVIPKGSRLIGRVTDVQQRAKNGAASKLGLVFDQLQNGQMLTPITASVVSITNANAAASVGDTLDSDLSGSSSTSSRTSSGGSGGGLLGGVTNTVGSVVNTAGQTVGGVTNTAGQALGTATSTAGRTINGLQISTSASGSAQSSTTLSSPNNNVRLEKGVTFNMNVQRSGGN